MEEYKKKLKETDENLLWFESGNLLSDMTAVLSMWEQDTFELLGISTVGENSDASCLQGLIELMGWDIPVATSEKEKKDSDWDDLRAEVLEERTPSEMIREQAFESQQISFLVDGPFTNLAEALKEEEHLKDHIKDIFFAATEENIKKDNAAFRYVVKEVPVFLIDEEMISRCQMGEDEIRAVHHTVNPYRKILQRIFSKSVSSQALVLLYAFVMKDGIIYEDQKIEGLDAVQLYRATEIHREHFVEYVTKFLFY